MRYLLDTHVFIWLAHQSTNLSARVHSIVADSDHNIFLSIASIWEMQIKAQLGKLELKAPLEQIVREQQGINRIQLLSITLDHVVELGLLPNHHRDPFDRLLIAQARRERFPLLTQDTNIIEYPVTVIW